MSELNFKMGTANSPTPNKGKIGEVFFTTDEDKYGQIYFIDRTSKVINIIPELLGITHEGIGATIAAEAITNLGAMDLTSAQTASGVKTFSNGIKIGNTTMSYDSTNKRLIISVSKGV